MTEGSRVSIPFPAPSWSGFLQGQAAMSPAVDFFTQNVWFVSIAFQQAQGMGKSCPCRLTEVTATGVQGGW